MFTILGADGKEYGPVNVDQVKAWISGGSANLETKAKRAGEDVWKRLSDFAEFAGMPSSPPPITSLLAGRVAVDPKAYAEALIARAAPLDVFGCLSRGWELLKSDFWSIVGATTLVMLAFLFASFVLSFIPVLGVLASFMLRGILMGGLIYFYLKKIRKEKADVADAFAGFSLALVPLLLVGLVSSLLTAVGILLLVLPGIYLAVAYAFAVNLVIDKKLDFWPAMEVSRRVITAQWWRVFALVILGGLITAVGVIGFGVGIFVTATIAIGAVVFAYEDLCNPPAKS